MSVKAKSEKQSFSSFLEALKLMESAHTIAVVTHLNPDPDALGSLCGMKYLIESLSENTEVELFNRDAQDHDLYFIQATKSVRSFPEKDWKPDLIIVCDCGELHRVGEELEQWIEGVHAPVINIDHHQSNPEFGKVNLLRVGASSTCEILFDLYEASDGKLSLSQEAADCLLVGILGDTGGFRYRSTTAETLRKASHLVECGARIGFLSQHLFGSVPLSTMRLNAYAIEHMKIFADGRIAGVCLTEEDYSRAGASSSDGEGIVELLRDIEGIELSYSVRRVDKEWKASLRTALDDVDLSEVARAFGGGGHKAASAFRSTAEISVFLPKLESLLEEALQKSSSVTTPEE